MWWNRFKNSVLKQQIHHPATHNLCTDQTGLAYLEFAISIPFMIALLMGAVETTRFILITQKVEKTAMTISNAVTVGNTVSSSALGNIIYASTVVMQPYTFGPNGYVIISSVTQTGNYTVNNPPKVNWQYVSSGSNGSWTQTSKIGASGSSATLPAGLTLYDKDNIIITEVFYNFTPIVPTDGILSSSKTLYSIGVYRPRLGALSTLSALPFWLTATGAVL